MKTCLMNEWINEWMHSQSFRRIDYAVVINNRHTSVTNDTKAYFFFMFLQFFSTWFLLQECHWQRRSCSQVKGDMANHELQLFLEASADKWRIQFHAHFIGQTKSNTYFRVRFDTIIILQGGGKLGQHPRGRMWIFSTITQIIICATDHPLTEVAHKT